VIPIDQAKGLALALPGTEEMDHHGRPSYRVQGKIFATLWDTGHMNLMLKSEDIYAAIDQNPGACIEFIWGGRPQALHVDLRRITPKALEKLLRQAWIQKAPKTLQPASGGR
jgi:hypothetical protein